jgi:hypothetical protein
MSLSPEKIVLAKRSAISFALDPAWPAPSSSRWLPTAAGKSNPKRTAISTAQPIYHKKSLHTASDK